MLLLTIFVNIIHINNQHVFTFENRQIPVFKQKMRDASCKM